MVGTLRLACFVLVSLTFCQASISPCRVDDESCLISAAQTLYGKIMAGDPSIGADTCDPLKLDHIDGSLTILKYKFENSTLLGYADCQVKNISVDTNELKLKMKLYCPEISMTGNYDMNGRLIVLPVEGAGNFSLTIYSYDIQVDAEYKIVKTYDDKEYLSIKNYNFEVHTDVGGHFYFDNLFNGRKDLADTVLKFANENSIEVLNEFQRPIQAASYKKFFKNANKHLKAMPMEHFFLE